MGSGQCRKERILSGPQASDHLISRLMLPTRIVVWGVLFMAFLLQSVPAHAESQDALYIDKNGNVGVGTVEPKAKLDVAGTVRADLLQGPGSIPIGGIIMWSGKTVPDGWALCDGSTVNGLETPDLRGRFIVGYHPEDGDYNEPGDLSGKGNTAGKTGGQREVTLTTAQMSSHTHLSQMGEAGNHFHDIRRSHPGGNVLRFTWKNGEGTFRVKAGNDGEGGAPMTTGMGGQHAHGLNIQNEGGNQPHENRPPYYVLAFIIRIK
jgi:microcystin-dependent protein